MKVLPSLTSARLLLSLLLLSGGLGVVDYPAWGFTVTTFRVGILPFHSDGNHEAITLEALNTVKAPLFGIEFSKDAKIVIQDANVQVDSDFYNVNFIHFDDESFAEGNKYLFDLRIYIVDLARSGEFNPGNYIKAQELLGKALHTVQDFYAHSTWVEKGKPGVAPLGVSSSDKLFVKSQGRTCTESATQIIDNNPTGIVRDVQLTGGFFDVSQVIGNSTWTNLPNDKCIHGSSAFRSDQHFGAGINKDKEGRYFFEKAHAYAVTATKSYVGLILSDLGTNEKAVRGLLGVGYKWDAVADFSLINNPNGPWRYSYDAPGKTAQLMGTTITTFPSKCSGLPVRCWKVSSDAIDLPFIAINNSGSTIASTTVVIPDGFLVLHPGSTPSDQTGGLGQRPVVSWIAPEDGAYVISGKFQILDVIPSGVRVFVLVDSSKLIDVGLNGYGNTVPVGFSSSLFKGQVVSFIVDAAGTAGNDSTGLIVTITRQ